MNEYIESEYGVTMPGGDSNNGAIQYLYKFDTTNYPEIVLIQYQFQEGPK